MKNPNNITILGGHWKHGSYFGVGLTEGKQNEYSLDNPGGAGRIPVVLHGIGTKRKQYEYKTRRLGAYADNVLNRSANRDKFVK